MHYFDFMLPSRSMLNSLLLAMLAASAVVASVAAAEPTAGDAAGEKAIRATAEAFTQAFNHGDAKAVAALWTETGSLADDRGRVFKGRKAIEDEYAAFFQAQPGAKMEVAVQSIELSAPNEPYEDGLARVVTKNGPERTASRYTAVHVLLDGKWLMAGVRETGIESAFQLRAFAAIRVAYRELAGHVRSRHGRHERPMDRQQEFSGTAVHRAGGTA